MGPLAQSVEPWNLDRRVPGLNLDWGGGLGVNFDKRPFGPNNFSHIVGLISWQYLLLTDITCVTTNLKVFALTPPWARSYDLPLTSLHFFCSHLLPLISSLWTLFPRLLISASSAGQLPCLDFLTYFMVFSCSSLHGDFYTSIRTVDFLSSMSWSLVWRWSSSPRSWRTPPFRVGSVVLPPLITTVIR